MGEIYQIKLFLSNARKENSPIWMKKKMRGEVKGILSYRKEKLYASIAKEKPEKDKKSVNTNRREINTCANS